MQLIDREGLMKALEKMAKATKDGKVGKSHITKVEDTVKEYKVKLTAARQKASSMAKPLEKLLQLQDEGVAVTKAVASAKSVQEIFEIQSEYAKSSMDNYLAELNKTSELFSDLFKTSFKPLNDRVSAAVDLAQSQR